MKYYLFAILENTENIITTFFIISTVLMAFYIIGMFITSIDEDDHERMKQLGKYFIPFYIILTLICTFTPSQKQMAFIIAAPYILENKDLQDSAQNTAEIIKMGTEYLKKALEEKTNGQ